MDNIIMSHKNKFKKSVSTNIRLSFLLFGVILIFSCQPLADINNEAYQPGTKGTASINANSVQQYIRGFGGASIRGWIDDLTTEQRRTAFSVNDGIGMSVLRVRVSPDSSDWSAEKATIDAAKSYGAMVVASAWTAPASMKTNNDLVGGNLKTSSYAEYATHLRNFCSTAGGVSAISPINEPNITVSYESMEMTATDVANFVAAQGGNCGAPIMAPEPYNMSQSFINQYLGNSTAGSNTSYVCGHIYGATPSYFDPGKEVWMTEHYVDSSTSGNDWSKSMKVAKEIHDCMNAGYSMYVWWYIRRSYGPIDENGNVTKTGYVMAHWAKWVRPGYNKISCTANPTSGVYMTAYKTGSTLVIVAVNQNSFSVTQNLSLSGASVSGFDVWTTNSSSNLTSGSASGSGTSFSISLPGSSVTTLRSNGTATTTTTTTSTSVSTTTTSTSGGSSIGIELESLSGQGSFSPFAVQSDSSASGGQYIVWPNNGSNQILSSPSDSATGQVAIGFTLSQTANVQFRIRADMANGNDDSFYYKIDSGSWSTQNNSSTSGWGTLTPATFNNLSPGSHTLQILRREDGAKLDMVTLTASAGTISSGGGTTTTTTTTTTSTSTSTTTTTTSSAGSTSIEVELESLSGQSSFSPFAVQSDSSASGGQYIVWPNNGSNQYLSSPSDSASGQVTIGFTLSQRANVQFRIRADMANGNDDSFYYKIDSTSWSTQNNSSTNGWATLTPTTFNNLSAGSHTLRILRREDGAKLDMVTLTVSAGTISR